MSLAVTVGYWTVAVLAYAFTIGVMARVFRRSTWAHTGEAAEFFGGAEKCRIVTGRGPCSCDQWALFAVVWPLALVWYVVWHIARIVAIAAYQGTARALLAGFNLGRRTPHDSEVNEEQA